MTQTLPTSVAETRTAIRTVAVLGAGIMGRGIAYAAALGGFETRLQDANEPALDSTASTTAAQS